MLSASSPSVDGDSTPMTLNSFSLKDTVQLESTVGVDVIQQERFKFNPCCFYNESLVPFPVYRCLIGRLEIGQWVLFTLLC